ncbi:MAG: hypothetical protein IJP52_01720 [Paludibacteraceae bacterium]|nr:hypothetical protein [Paludibacteraceae bacterium]
MKKFFIISVITVCGVNAFAADENTAVVTFTSSACPVGAVSEKALFSVADGKQVYFSQGNLQYQASTNTWRFAEHQYDFAGDGGSGGSVMGNMGAANNNNNISSSYSGWIDLFCWAACGYHDNDDEGNLYYAPYEINTTGYGGGYGPSDGTTGIAGTNYDWGIYLPISNGGNEVGQWRTLTAEEWTYLVSRSDSKISLGMVNGTRGLILLPDDWMGSALVGAWYDWDKNVFTLETWGTMESNGAVFLPAALNRNPTTVYYGGPLGRYWLASACPDCYLPERKARTFAFSTGMVTVGTPGNSQRTWGCSVRLVRDK